MTTKWYYWLYSSSEPTTFYSFCANGVEYYSDYEKCKRGIIIGGVLVNDNVWWVVTMCGSWRND